MKKLYIVISSWDEYDDHYKVNELVCSSISFAEKMKEELEVKYRQELPFPFSEYTFEEFLELFQEGNVAQEDAKTFMTWEDEKNKLNTFNGCFINEIDFYDEQN